MASLINKIAKEWRLVQHDNLLSGRINDIFVNLTFVKHIRVNANEVKRDYNKPAEVAAFEALIQPKYDNVTVDVYVSRKGEIDIPELSGFLDTNYENFRTSLPVYVNGHFSITLYQRDYVNVKAWYVTDFLNVLTSFLNERGYFSGCQKCGGNDNLSQVYYAGRSKEICENCHLKEAKL
jgi:hypothetical protein